MADRIKIGAKVDETVYNNFVQFVEEKRGQKRGVLGDEIGNALRGYMSGDNDESSDITNEDIMAELQDLKTGEGGTPLAASESDGGARARRDESVEDLDTASDTSLAESAPTEKPGGNETRQKKAEYLAATLNKTGKVSLSIVEEHVSDEYGFDDDLCEWYAWNVAGQLAPDVQDFPKGYELPREDMNADEDIQGSGAWYSLDTRTRKHEFSTPETDGKMYVFLGKEGAEDWGDMVGAYSESEDPDDSDGSNDSEEEADELNFDDVDIDGAESPGGGGGADAEEVAEE